MSAPQKPSVSSQLSQVVFHAISFGALILGILMLMAALFSPSSYGYDEQGLGYLAGIYNALVSLALFAVFVLIQVFLYFVRRGAAQTPKVGE